MDSKRRCADAYVALVDGGDAVPKIVAKRVI